jgi:hypothetical protein
MQELFSDEELPPRKRPWRVPRGTDLPPPPPGTRHVAVPTLGLVIADDDLRRRVEHFFYWPMIALALAVLPLFLIELSHPEDRTELFVDIAFAIIWLAFLVEFVTKITIAESRVEYVRRNWLDLVIILLPILRALRLTSLVRMGRLLKLRGVAFKLLRTVIVLFVTFEVADRLMRRLGVQRPPKPARPTPESMTRASLQDEVRRLRTRTDQWQAWYTAHRTWLEARGIEAADAPEADATTAAQDAPPSTPQEIPP